MSNDMDLQPVPYPNCKSVIEERRPREEVAIMRSRVADELEELAEEEERLAHSLELRGEKYNSCGLLSRRLSRSARTGAAQIRTANGPRRKPTS